MSEHHEAAIARAYVGGARWQFAQTMPQWPHEYTLVHWAPDREVEFHAFALFIWQYGVVKPWPADSPNPKYHHTYLELDGWEYWTMGEPCPETTLVNRALAADG